MTAAGTAGEVGGRIVGGLLGGALGSLIPIPGVGTMIGRAVGSRLGGLAGRAAAVAIENWVESAEGAEEEATETDEAAGATTGEEVCEKCVQECRDAAANVKEALYRNKRSPQNGNDGRHGYMNRMIEQMCGASGPGTPGWQTHINELVGQQRHLRRSFAPFTGNPPKCNPQDHFSESEREVIDNILSSRDGWSPTTIPHLGSNHPGCVTVAPTREGGRIRDYLDIIRTPRGPSGPMTS